jgi:cytochrome c5
MTNFKNVLVFIASFTIAGFAGVATAKHMSDHNIEERLKPVHSVYVEGDEVPQVANAAPAAAGGGSSAARSGEQIYNTNCMACHTTGAAGAPKIGDAADWNARMEKGIDTVYSHAIDGFNAMPPKGTCADCSDDEIKATVDYILENSN